MRIEINRNYRSNSLFRILIMIGVFLCMGSTLQAGETVPHSADSVMRVDSLQPQKRKSFLKRFLQYFNDANKNRKQKKFDFSVIGGPHYSSSVGLGLGLMGSGLYYPGGDTLVPPSNVTLFGDIATTGFCMIGIRGNNLFKKDRYRLNYKMYLYSFPTQFYGWGYQRGVDKTEQSTYNRFQSKIEVNFLWRLAKGLFLGPEIHWDYVHGTKVQHPASWHGQDMTVNNVSAGVNLVYDTRDNFTAPWKGVYLNFNQRFYPKALGNERYHFNNTELTANFYTPVWKGCVLAAQVHGYFTYDGEVPWFQMGMVGGSNSMRGYFEGQYRDRNMIDGQVELRQKVWKRNGVVAWIGAANVFPSFSALRVRQVLPNYGIGYRWEFKKRVNVRFDFGLGKKTKGFLFNINEAF